MISVTAGLGILEFLLMVPFIVVFVVVALDESTTVRLRSFLGMIGWYNADKKKGWRLVQDGNNEFNLQKFNFGTFTWDTFEHFADEEDALIRYDYMNDIWKEEHKDLANDKKAQKKYESNAKKIKKVIK